MEDLRRRIPEKKEDPRAESESDHKEEPDSEDDKVDLSNTVAQGTDKTPEVLTEVLSGLPSRWRNWVIRGIFTLVMIGAFGFIIYLGPLALMITTLLVQVKCFEEIINIGYAVYKIHGLPWFRSLSWYFLLASNYFFYGESLVDYFGVAINRTEYLKILVTYHRFISFCLYVGGFVWFVLSLVKKYYMKQFSLFAWTHVSLLIVVTQSYLIIQNIFHGLIWFIVPVSMIVCNDVWAYLFGFFFGRTPLIKLSPKKTWEGFIGGGFATVIFGLILVELNQGCISHKDEAPLCSAVTEENNSTVQELIEADRLITYVESASTLGIGMSQVSYILCQYQYFVCPIEYSEELGRMTMECDPSPLFRPQEYTLPPSLASIATIFGFSGIVTMYPFLLHSLSMSLFSSVIGPFGGFFASGFKRAFKIKDFGDVIPGHGGIMDRFDCQYLMATFVNVYITSFIQTSSPQKILQLVLTLKPEQQLSLFNMLRSELEEKGILSRSVMP